MSPPTMFAVKPPLTIAVLAGDGIGPEIVAEAVKVLEAPRGSDSDSLLKAAPVGAAACLQSQAIRSLSRRWNWQGRRRRAVRRGR